MGRFRASLGRSQQINVFPWQVGDGVHVIYIFAQYSNTQLLSRYVPLISNHVNTCELCLNCIQYHNVLECRLNEVQQVHDWKSFV